MILLIDISILLFIIGFMISKTLYNDHISEYIKLICVIGSLIVINIFNIDFLKIYIIKLTANSFEINPNQIHHDFFYMISFLIQFFSIFYILIIITKYVKNKLSYQYSKKEIKYQSIHRVLIIVSSFIRSIIFLCILVFVLESFPFDINQTDNDINSSKTYNLISRISSLLIK